MAKTLIRNAKLVTEDGVQEKDILFSGDLIEKIDGLIDSPGASETDAKGQYLFPGAIDDQVHFRQPGLTQKADIASESAAAVAGGVTSFMDMPNVKPASLTQALLEERYAIASEVSPANYSFYMGASNDNLEEVLKTDPKNICGIKVFMGSSTGNMLVDDHDVLDGIFSRAPILVAVHCEDEARIRARSAEYKAKYGEEVPFTCHPEIRDEEACLLSSKLAVELAKKHKSRLHILHISTADELGLFEVGPVESKRITSEACVHHMWFDADGYESMGSKIKCNPAIKDKKHRPQIIQALVDDRIDVVATDHAPHTVQEKAGTYFNAPSGLPLVQHSVQMMFDLHKQGFFPLQLIAEKMSQAVARCFQIEKRGFIKEGYHADAYLLDSNKPYTVSKENLLFKCGWSPLEGHTFGSSITATWVNGELVWNENGHTGKKPGARMRFLR